MNASHKEDMNCCVCCKYCNRSQGSDFQKLLHLKDTGIVIYNYKTSHPTEPIFDDVFILHNTKDAVVPQEVFVSEFEHRKVECPKCKYLMDRTEKILTSVKTLNRNEIKSICEHCRKKMQTQFNCIKCEKAANKFIRTIGNLMEYPKTNTDLKLWIEEQHLLKYLIGENADLKSEFQSEMFPLDIGQLLSKSIVSIESETDYDCAKNRLDILRNDNPKLFKILEKKHADLFGFTCPLDCKTLLKRLELIKTEYPKVFEKLHQNHPQLFASKSEYDRTKRHLDKLREEYPELFQNLQRQYAELFRRRGFIDLNTLQKQLELIKTEHPEVFENIQQKQSHLFALKSDYDKTKRQLNELREDNPQLFASLQKQYPDLFNSKNQEDIYMQLNFIKSKYPREFEKFQLKYPELFYEKLKHVKKQDDEKFDTTSPEFEAAKKELDNFKEENPEFISKLQKQFPDLLGYPPRDLQKLHQQLQFIKAKHEKILQESREAEAKKHKNEPETGGKIAKQKTKNEIVELFTKKKTSQGSQPEIQGTKGVKRERLRETVKEIVKIPKNKESKVSEKETARSAKKERSVDAVYDKTRVTGMESGGTTQNYKASEYETGLIDAKKSVKETGDKEKVNTTDNKKGRDYKKQNNQVAEKEKTEAKGSNNEKEKDRGGDQAKGSVFDNAKGGGVGKETARAVDQEKRGNFVKEKASGADNAKSALVEKENNRGTDQLTADGVNNEKSMGAGHVKKGGAEKAQGGYSEKEIVTQKEKIKIVEKKKGGDAEKANARGANTEKKEKVTGVEKKKYDGAENEKTRIADKEKGRGKKDKDMRSDSKDKLEKEEQNKKGKGKINKIDKIKGDKSSQTELNRKTAQNKQRSRFESVSNILDLAKSKVGVENLKKTKSSLRIERQQKALEQSNAQRANKTMEVFDVPLSPSFTDAKNLYGIPGLYFDESNIEISEKDILVRSPSYDHDHLLEAVKTTDDDKKMHTYCLDNSRKPHELIVSTKIVKKGNLYDIKEDALLFHTHYRIDSSLDIPEEEEKTEFGLQKASDNSGIVCYTLSDRSFIEKGWTMLPVVKVVRKVNLYRMIPPRPEFNWFERNKQKRLIFYETREKLVEFDEPHSSRCHWYYKNEKLALDYYPAEEENAGQRVVIYSNGERDKRGQSRPLTVLATFDYLGNGIVFDHTGKIRLKYNQSEGITLDKDVGPVSRWKWNDLNDPPVLQQVIVDTHVPFKDPEITRLGSEHKEQVFEKEDDEEILALEFENFLKEQEKKVSSSKRYKSFPISMKALKINDNFSLRILDQSHIYLQFRDCKDQIKVNLGMTLDPSEIIDTDSAEMGEITSNIERMPARTSSVAEMQRIVARAQNLAKYTQDRKEKINPSVPVASIDKLKAPISQPLRRPLIHVKT